jgi:hypothetical protein
MSVILLEFVTTRNGIVSIGVGAVKMVTKTS